MAKPKKKKTSFWKKAAKAAAIGTALYAGAKGLKGLGKRGVAGANVEGARGANLRGILKAKMPGSLSTDLGAFAISVAVMLNFINFAIFVIVLLLLMFMFG